MQPSRSLVALLLFLLCAHSTSAAVVHARQAEDGSAPTSAQRSAEPTTTAGNTAESTSQATRTATNIEASSAVATSIESRTRDSAEPSVTADVSTTALTDIPSAAVPSDAAAASSTGELSCTSNWRSGRLILKIPAAVYSGHGLPLTPKVTPAIGITGAVLIITGVIYTLIGIKNHWSVSHCPRSPQ